MTFAARTFQGMNTGGVNQAFSASAYSDTVKPSTSNAGVTFNADGTCSGGPNWYTTTTSGIGSAYWVRFTLSSGSAWTGTAAGTVTSLSSSPSVNWSRGGTAYGTTSATVTVQFYSDSGGVNLVATGGISASVTYENNL